MNSSYIIGLAVVLLALSSGCVTAGSLYSTWTGNAGWLNAGDVIEFVFLREGETFGKVMYTYVASEGNHFVNFDSMPCNPANECTAVFSHQTGTDYVAFNNDAEAFEYVYVSKNGCFVDVVIANPMISIVNCDLQLVGHEECVVAGDCQGECNGEWACIDNACGCYVTPPPPPPPPPGDKNVFEVIVEAIQSFISSIVNFIRGIFGG